MSETRSRFTVGRVEAFSDGVIAVIITIMVLELKAPESAEIKELLRLWPNFAIYLISFAFTAIYWINHHELFSLAKRVTPGIIWANTALLFFLSLIPFATAYVGATKIAPIPTAIYGALQLLCGIAFRFLTSAIVRERTDDPQEKSDARARERKAYIATAAYAAATGIALVMPWISLVIFVAVAGFYVLPGLFFGGRERVR